MKGHSGVCVSAKRASSDAWNTLMPGTGGQTARYPAREVKIKTYGVGSTGSGAHGYKAKPARLLQRALADRAGVNIAVKARQAAAVEARARPPVVIQGLLGASA